MAYGTVQIDDDVFSDGDIGGQNGACTEDASFSNDDFIGMDNGGIDDGGKVYCFGVFQTFYDPFSGFCIADGADNIQIFFGLFDAFRGANNGILIDFCSDGLLIINKAF